jgi:hypothetical protein
LLANPESWMEAVTAAFSMAMRRNAISIIFESGSLHACHSKSAIAEGAKAPIL